MESSTATLDDSTAQARGTDVVAGEGLPIRSHGLQGPAESLTFLFRHAPMGLRNLCSIPRYSAEFSQLVFIDPSIIGHMPFDPVDPALPESSRSSGQGIRCTSSRQAGIDCQQERT